MTDTALEAALEAAEAKSAWERDEHDKARTEWLLMRDRLNGLRDACANALTTTEPPATYAEPWCGYEGDVEAAPWAWLQTLLVEALTKYEAFDEAAWDVEQGLRREERERLAAALEAAEAENRRLREALAKAQAIQPRTLERLRSEGIVFEHAPMPGPDLFEQVAFWIYTDLCEVESIARAELAGSGE